MNSSKLTGFVKANLSNRQICEQIPVFTEQRFIILQQHIKCRQNRQVPYLWASNYIAQLLQAQAVIKQ